MNMDNWVNFLKIHWIIGLVGILLLVFIIEVIQLIISRYRSKLSTEQQEQLKEISRLMRKIKFPSHLSCDPITLFKWNYYIYDTTKSI